MIKNELLFIFLFLELSLFQIGPLESRRLWHRVTKALLTRPTPEWDTASSEKSFLEAIQRELPVHKLKIQVE